METYAKVFFIQIVQKNVLLRLFYPIRIFIDKITPCFFCILGLKMGINHKCRIASIIYSNVSTVRFEYQMFY